MYSFSNSKVAEFFQASSQDPTYINVLALTVWRRICTKFEFLVSPAHFGEYTITGRSFETRNHSPITT